MEDDLLTERISSTRGEQKWDAILSYRLQDNWEGWGWLANTILGRDRTVIEAVSVFATFADAVYCTPECQFDKQERPHLAYRVLAYYFGVLEGITKTFDLNPRQLDRVRKRANRALRFHFGRCLRLSHLDLEFFVVKHVLPCPDNFSWYAAGSSEIGRSLTGSQISVVTKLANLILGYLQLHAD